MFLTNIAFKFQASSANKCVQMNLNKQKILLPVACTCLGNLLHQVPGTGILSTFTFTFTFTTRTVALVY